MFDKLKSLFKKTKPVAEKSPVEKKPRKPRKSREEKVVSEKDQATAAGLPYIKIIEMDIDANNINAGSISFDWNDKFLLNLIKNGYKQRPDDTDNIIVDRWFQTVCRNIALEVYEQQQADPLNREEDDLRRVNRKDLGNGRSEIS